MEDYPIYAGGEFVETTQPLDVKNKYNGENFARTWLAGHEEFETAANSAVAIQDELREVPPYQRYEILMSIARNIRADIKKFTEVLSMESGKPYRYAFAEINRAVQTFTVAAEESRRLPKEYMSLDWTPEVKAHEGLVKYFPIGPVAGISPFNFPLNLAAHKIAPAIAAGCPIVLKPASSTPLSTLLLSQVIDETTLPKGAVSILPMDRQTGNMLVTDERFKLLTFTGSPEVGWQMKADAGKKKVVLELGGNAGVIISSNADIGHAVKRCITGGFAYSGQICIHAQRIYVHTSIFREFENKFTEAAKTLKYGDPLDPETDISVMIDEPNAIRVEQWVNEAVTGGAKILCGGKREGTYYEPTILTNTRSDMKVCGLEIFGPVVTLEPFETFTEAVLLVNEGRYGLQAGVFTNDVRELDFAFNHLEVGGIIHNDVPTFRVDQMPYGGIKDSGLGREGVKYAILDMMEPRILVRNS